MTKARLPSLKHYPPARPRLVAAPPDRQVRIVPSAEEQRAAARERVRRAQELTASRQSRSPLEQILANQNEILRRLASLEGFASSNHQLLTAYLLGESQASQVGDVKEAVDADEGSAAPSQEPSDASGDSAEPDGAA